MGPSTTLMLPRAKQVGTEEVGFPHWLHHSPTRNEDSVTLIEREFNDQAEKEPVGFEPGDV